MAHQQYIAHQQYMSSTCSEPRRPLDLLIDRRLQALVVVKAGIGHLRVAAVKYLQESVGGAVASGQGSGKR